MDFDDLYKKPEDHGEKPKPVLPNINFDELRKKISGPEEEQQAAAPSLPDIDFDSLRRRISNEPEKTGVNLLKDPLASIARGTASLAQAAVTVSNLPKAAITEAISGGLRGAGLMEDKTARQLSRVYGIEGLTRATSGFDAIQKGLEGFQSDQWKESTAKEFIKEVEKGEGWFGSRWKPGEGVTSPVKIVDIVLQSIPASAAGMGGGLVVTKALIGLTSVAGRAAMKPAIARIVGAAVGEGGKRAPAIAGIIGSAMGEGGVAGSMAFNQMIREMQGLSDEEVVSSPYFQEKYGQNITPDNIQLARNAMSLTGGLTVGILSAMGVGVLGSPSGAFIGRVINGETGKTLFRTILKSTALEGFQELTQEPTEQLVENLATKWLVDRNQSLTEGLGEAAIGGFLSGAVPGAGLGKVAHTHGVQKRQQQEATSLLEGFTGRPQTEIGQTGQEVISQMTENIISRNPSPLDILQEKLVNFYLVNKQGAAHPDIYAMYDVALDSVLEIFPKEYVDKLLGPHIITGSGMVSRDVLNEIKRSRPDVASAMIDRIDEALAETTDPKEKALLKIRRDDLTRGIISIPKETAEKPPAATPPPIPETAVSPTGQAATPPPVPEQAGVAPSAEPPSAPAPKEKEAKKPEGQEIDVETEVDLEAVPEKDLDRVIREQLEDKIAKTTDRRDQALEKGEKDKARVYQERLNKLQKQYEEAVPAQERKDAIKPQKEKEVQDAEKIRKDERPVQGGRPERQRGEEEGGPDIQQPEKAGTETGVEKETQVTPPKKALKPKGYAGEVFKHFTSKESKEALERGEAFDFAKEPIHGTGSLGGEPRTGRFAGDRIYLSLDDSVWAKTSRREGEDQVVDAPQDPEAIKKLEDQGAEFFFDYDKQKWQAKVGAKVAEKQLEPVNFRLAKDARVKIIDSEAALREAAQEVGQPPRDNPAFWEKLAEKYDAVALVNVKQTAEKTDNKFFRQAQGDQIIVLNQDKVTMEKPVAGKKDVSGKPQAKTTKAFQSTIKKLKAESPGRRIFNIHQVRKEMGNPKDFDAFIEQARKDQTIQLHGGDPSVMTEEQIKSSYKDDKGNLWIGVSWLGVKKPAKKIEDFGEVLEGAKKHYYQDYAKKLKNVPDGDIINEPFSKIWPLPNYQKMIEEGADPIAVAFIRAARDEVPNKPRGRHVGVWASKVKLLRDLSQQLLNGEITTQKLIDTLKTDKYRNLAPLLDTLDLYQAVGHEKSLKGISISKGLYSMHNGVEYKPAKEIWTISKKAKATAWSNWPTTIAEADTREQAIEIFKEKFKEFDDSPTKTKKPQKNRYEIRQYNHTHTDPNKRGKYFITRKNTNYYAFKTFEEIKEAREFLQNNQEWLDKQVEKFKFVPDKRRESNSPRVGTDHRNGLDVNTDQFKETFGFRGGQFGNYVEQGKRQQDLNETYDALMDMAGVLDIPPKALSLDGELGLAFGARGSGKAKAHYEPDTVVINLTKKSGAGSLAHEWWHAVDNYFARKRGEAVGYISLAPREKGEGVRPELIHAFKGIVDAINKTGMPERSEGLDQRRSKPYWQKPHEMTARAFESYIINKLEDQGVRNDYLANIVSLEAWEAATKAGLRLEGTYPYPTQKELPEIRNAYDAFFDTASELRGPDGKLPVTETSVSETPKEAFSKEELSARAKGAYASGDLDAGQYMVVIDLLVKNELESVSKILAAIDETKQDNTAERTIGEIKKAKAKGKANVDRLIKMLGAQMYKANLTEVTIKETIQNSFDAVKASLNKKIEKEGKIDIVFDARHRLIAIKDNGQGMTPKTIRSAFLTLAGTEKSGLGEGESSGGLGMAKAAFLLGNEWIYVRTSKDGIRSTFKTTAQDIFSKEFEIEEMTVDRSEHGTLLVIKVPETIEADGQTQQVYFPYYEGEISFFNRPLIHDKLTVRAMFADLGDGGAKSLEDPDGAWTEYDGRFHDVAIGKNFDLSKYTKHTSAKFSWGRADIYIGIERIEKSYWLKHDILSSGLYQFNDQFNIRDMEAVPYNLLINIFPEVKADAISYPFDLKREGWKSTIAEDIKALKKYVANVAAGIDAQGTVDSFKTIKTLPRLDIETIGTVNVDVSEFIKPIKPKEKKEIKPLFIPPSIDIKGGVVKGKNEKNKVVEYVNLPKERQDKGQEKLKATFKADKEAPTAKDFLLQMDIDDKKPVYHNNTNVDYQGIAAENKHNADLFFAEIGSVFLKVKDLVVEKGGWFYSRFKGENSQLFVGISIDKKYHGVQIPVPFKGVFLNPLAVKSNTLPGLAYGYYKTMLHEMAHLAKANHNEGFTSELARLETDFASDGTDLEIRMALTRVLKKHQGIINLLRGEYEKSTTRNIAKSLHESEKGGGGTAERRLDASDGGVEGGLEIGQGSLHRARGGIAGQGVRPDAGSGREGEQLRGASGGVQVSPVGDVRFKRTDFKTFSEMERVLSKPGMLPKNSTRKGMVNAIKKHVGKFKGVELNESGLIEHIQSMKQDMVTRQDVLDYLDMNRIELEEVTKTQRHGALSNTGARVQDLQRAVNKVMNRFAGLKKDMVQVFQSENQLPGRLQTALEKQNMSGKFDALHWDGKVYLVADNLTKESMAELSVVEGLLRHEGRHHAIEQIFSGREARDNFFGQVAEKYAGSVDAYLRQHKLEDTPENRIIAAEEVIVDRIKAGETGGIIDRFIAKIANFLRTLFPKLKISNAEVRELIARADSIIEGRDGVAPVGKLATGAMYKIAHHGTPHTWPAEPGFPHGRPRLDKIGTGEGAQMYGWGIYFAEAEAVGQEYAKSYSHRKMYFDGEAIETSGLKDKIKEKYGREYDALASRISTDWQFRFLPDDILATVKRVRPEKEHAIAEDILAGLERFPQNQTGWIIRLKGGIRAEGQMTPQEKSAYFDILGRAGWYHKGKDPLAKMKQDFERSIEVQDDWIKQIKKGKAPGERIEERQRIKKEAQTALDVIEKYGMYATFAPEPSLYRLDIPDSVMPKLLDFDRPLKEQSDEVKKALKQAYEKADGDLKKELNHSWDSADDGSELYNSLKSFFGGQQAASEYLASIGIPGNKFLDQFSRQESQGTHNYVIWDQKVLDRIALLERNQEKLQEMQSEEGARFKAEEIKAYDDALYAHEYVGLRAGRKLTGEEKRTRKMAYGIKAASAKELKEAAAEMAAKIPGDKSKAVLVPIPGHTGETAVNTALAQEIAKITGGKVEDVLKRVPGESQRERRVKGRRPQKPEELETIATRTIPDSENVYFIDNVISSGATIRAARDAVGGGRGLVFAKGFSKGPKYLMGGQALATEKHLTRLELAQRMAGDAEKIWRETGWWNLGGDWKFEISPEKATLDATKLTDFVTDSIINVLPEKQKLNEEMKLGDQVKDPEKPFTTKLHKLYDYPELYELYPMAKYINVSVNFSPKEIHYRSTKKNLISINIGSVRGHEILGWIKDGTFPADKYRSVLEHELQHAIQNIESFPTGGSPETAISPELLTEVKQTRERYQELSQKDPGEMSALEIVEYTTLQMKLQELASKAKREGFRTYNLLTGEAEARMVQRRLKMTPEQRQAEPPWITLEKMLREEGLLKKGQKAEDVLIDQRAGDKGFSVEAKTPEDFVFHRGKDPKESANIVLAADDRGGVEQYGKNEFAIPKKNLVNMPKWVQGYAEKHYKEELGEEYDSYIKPQANPDDIVNSADVWDDPAFVSNFFEDNFSKIDKLIEKGIFGFKTKNGAVIFPGEHVEYLKNYDFERESRPRKPEPEFKPIDIKTKEFENWFRDSKVVDADGKPQMFFHGTTHDFTKFQRTGEIPDIGFHFGTSYQAESRLENAAQRKAAAEGRAFKTQMEDYTGTQIMPVYLSIQKPLVLPDAGTWTAGSIASIIEVKGKEVKQLTPAQKKRIKEIGQSNRAQATKDLRNYLQSLGFDGIQYYNRAEGGGTSYVAFEPTQIKSAIINTGAFSSTDPDIRFARKPAQVSKEDARSLNPEVQKRFKAAQKGVEKPTFGQRAKDTINQARDTFTRHFIHLDSKTDGAVIDILRRFQETPMAMWEQAGYQTVRFLKDMDQNSRDVFTYNLVLGDMLRDLESGTLELRRGESLPFGYRSVKEVQADFDHFQKVADKVPEIKKALEERASFMGNLRKDLVKHKLLPKDVLKADPNEYFHHQVLDYMILKKSPGISSKDLRTKKKGWQFARAGSLKDYSTNYLESEIEVISQGLVQVKTQEALDRIRKLEDKKGGLEGEAYNQNIAALEKKFAEMGELEDPLKPFKTNMAIGFSGLEKMAAKGELYAPDEYRDVVADLVKKSRERKEKDYVGTSNHPKMFQFLSWLINTKSNGAMEAATIFKAIKNRNRFIKDTLGKDFKTYRDLIPDGYTEWKPKPGQAFYFTNSLTDKILEDVLSGHKSLEEKDVQKVLARGRDAIWVIPDRIAATLDDFKPPRIDSLPEKIAVGALNKWKQWVLINPYRIIRYNINNMSGDLDISLAYDPKIAKMSVKAFNDLWKAYGKGKWKIDASLRKELDEARDAGVIGTGMTQMDIPDIGMINKMDEFMDVLDGKPPKGLLQKTKKGLEWYWEHSKGLTTLRENTLRLAAYRYFKERVQKTDGRNVYATSKKSEIDAMWAEGSSRNEIAAKLARELVGDYGNISQGGQWLRHKLIPFYSWIEINAPRYVRLFRNLKHEGRSTAGLGGVMAWKATKLGLKASLLFAMVNLWNATMFPDEDDELGEAKRHQMHLILGRKEDGTIVTLRFQGALSDALSWFGQENPIETYRMLAKGDYAGETMRAVKAPAEKIITGIRPEPKMLFETLTGSSLYPDPFSPKPIRDKMQHVLRTFSLDKLYNIAAGKPSKAGDWKGQFVEDLKSMFLYETDPGEIAYWEIRKKVFDFRKEQGHQAPTVHPTNRSNALYYYRQAIKFGDLSAAAKYYQQYIEYGGNAKNIAESIKRAHPMSSLPIKNRYQFRQSLNEKELKTLGVALNWYRNTYLTETSKKQ